MWAQLSTVRVNDGEADAVSKAMGVGAFEQPDSGLLRTMVLQDQKEGPGSFARAWSSSRARRRLEPARLIPGDGRAFKRCARAWARSS